MTRIGWRCRCCDAAGYDGPGLPTFWAHFTAFHMAPIRSIFHGVMGR